MEFKIIETQEQLDSIIGERLKRAEKQFEEKYSDYDDLKSQLEEKSKSIEGLTGQIEELTNAKKTFDETIAAKDIELKKFAVNELKTKVASSMGLSIGSVDFLKGETEEEIKASADALKKLTAPPPAPLKTTEPEKEDVKREALKSLTKSLIPNN